MLTAEQTKVYRGWNERRLAHQLFLRQGMGPLAPLFQFTGPHGPSTRGGDRMKKSKGYGKGGKKR